MLAAPFTNRIWPNGNTRKEELVRRLDRAEHLLRQHMDPLETAALSMRQPFGRRARKHRKVPAGLR